MGTRCELTHGADALGLDLAVPGRHNARNAAAAFAIATELGFDPSQVAAALAGYRGAMRRMELKGEVQGGRGGDSYGHHPAEGSADRAAARALAAGGRGIGLFPPPLVHGARLVAS